MAYFNHAYQKAFVLGNVDTGGAGAVNLKTAGNTSALGSGDFGVFDCSDYIGMTAANVTTLAQSTGSGGGNFGAYSSGKILLAQGAWHTADTLGGNALHGGYGESIKSKDIQFRHITRMNEIANAAAANQVVEFKVCGAASSQSCFPCGSDPQIRIDIKGADALRMLNHNAYRNIDIGAICHCCGDDGDFLDVKMVMATWASNIKKDPILSKLIDTSDNTGATTSFFGTTTLGPGGAFTAADPDTYISGTGCEAVWDANDCAVIRLNLGVVDTTFGTCSFDTRDWTNVEPLTATMELLEEDGVTCDTCLITTNPLVGAQYTNGGPAIGTTTSTGHIVVSADGTGTSVAPAQVIGEGNGVLKDVLLTQRYLQEPYNQGNKDSSRYRTIEGHEAILSAVSTSAVYYQFQLQHNVPRFNNPTGTFDNDQYLYTVYTDALAADGSSNGQISDLSDIWDRIAAGANITNTTL
jgi:hypothetical protein